MALTFMAKPNEREGNSCHIHFSLRSADGDEPVFGAGDGMSTLMKQALAGVLATMPEFSLMYAPNINSYKRFQPGSFAPTAVRWGSDNRSCALRVVGHSPDALRFENRVPGGDVNPYLAIAAIAAGVLHGIEKSLELEDAVTGNAYTDPTAPQVPGTLRDAAALWESGKVARQAFGDEVVEHYANYARVELAAFDAAVTDWELYRGFERL
jgi:glutamine synthetase